MAGLVPAIHVFTPRLQAKTWITGTSPVMTIERVEQYAISWSETCKVKRGHDGL